MKRSKSGGALTALVALATLVTLLSPAPAVGRRRAPKHRAPLDLLVKGKDPLLRETAAQVLGQRGAATAVPALIKAMAKDKNKWVRARCAEALGLIGEPKAIRPLTSALEREKDQRLRRMIAGALVRFGQRAGINELMWQLKAGTNHTKAEVMAFLVQLTGRPLGQDVEAWWAYLSARGGIFLARRPTGAPGIFELRGLSGVGPHVVVAPTAKTWWRALPAVVLRLRPRSGPVTVARLRAYQRRRGAIPDGSLLLIQSGWRLANARAAAGKSRGKGKSKGKSRSAGALPPGLTLEAARYLLKRAPGAPGLAIDAPSFDPPSARGAAPVMKLIRAGGKLALSSVDDMDRLPASGARLLVVAGTGGAVRLLAVLP
jgi:kynurenine formamidase